MKNTTHRVVILKNVNSELISQAILILKDNASAMDTQVMFEAEQIVEKYMNKSPLLPPRKAKHTVLAGILSMGIILTGCAIFIILKLM